MGGGRLGGGRWGRGGGLSWERIGDGGGGEAGREDGGGRVGAVVSACDRG